MTDGWGSVIELTVALVVLVKVGASVAGPRRPGSVFVSLPAVALWGWSPCRPWPSGSGRDC